MIIKYSKKYFQKLVDLDLNSDHPYYIKNKPKRKDILKWLGNKFKKGDEEFYLLKKENKIIGAIAWKKEFLFAKKACEITFLSIDKNYQRKGYATEMMNFLENKIKNKFKRVFLTTGINNKKAQKFYKKLGYEKYVILKDYYEKGDHSLCMRKYL